MYTREIVLAVLFFVISNPITYSIVDKLAMGFVDISNEDNAPTQVGVLIHSVVFVALYFLLNRYVLRL